jgi:parallel beta-helix repeat protein
LIVVLMGVFVVAFKFQRVKAGGSIYIRADGSIEGTTKISTINNVTYTFTDNINNSIMVERSHIVIDGAGCTLDGSGGWETGVILEYVAYNVTIQNAKITGFGRGISIISSWNNTISGNNITKNINGIFLNSVSNATFSGNNIIKNVSGIRLENCSNNKFYHNYFVNNTNQVHVELGDINIWDDGYNSGGNYWSDYQDKYSNAEERNESGIWDTPYVIDELNQDSYPILPELPSFMITLLFIIATMLATMICKRKQNTSN